MGVRGAVPRGCLQLPDAFERERAVRGSVRQTPAVGSRNMNFGIVGGDRLKRTKQRLRLASFAGRTFEIDDPSAEIAQNESSI